MSLRTLVSLAVLLIAMQRANTIRKNHHRAVEIARNSKKMDSGSSKNAAVSLGLTSTRMSASSSNSFAPLPLASRAHKADKLHAPQQVSSSGSLELRIDQTEKIGYFEPVDRATFKEEYDTMGQLASIDKGRVYQIRDRHAGNDLAMKLTEISGMRRAARILNAADVDEVWADIEREVNLQEIAASEHVVKIEKTITNADGDPAILMELMPDGTLADKLLYEPVTGDEVQNIFRQIVDGVVNIHFHDVVHLDLRPENIWCKDKSVKIGDFSSAMEVHERTEDFSVGGTYAAYMAPEFMRKLVDPAKHSPPLDLKAVDIWALGVILRKLITGLPPFTLPVGLINDVRRFLSVLDKDGFDKLLVPLPENVDEDAKDLISHMLEPDPSKRYTIEQVADHKYLDNRFDREPSDEESATQPRWKGRSVSSIVDKESEEETKRMNWIAQMRDAESFRDVIDVTE
jgi:serine/threonine protein kinase